MGWENKHKYSTIFLLVAITIVGIAIFAQGFDMGDESDLCISGESPKVINGIWTCVNITEGVIVPDSYENNKGSMYYYLDSNRYDRFVHNISDFGEDYYLKVHNGDEFVYTEVLP